jgi:hypothetical protein
MIEFAFVLLVSNTSMDEKYVGNFKSCEIAQIHYFMYEVDRYNGFRCIEKEYARLPEGTPTKNIDMSNGSFRYQSFKELCKARRNCT